MPNVKVNLKELFDPEFKWVSLVDKGANRIPFKILKSHGEEKTMIDMSAMFLRKTDGEAAIPANKQMTVAAVVIRKDSEDGDQDLVGKMAQKVKDLGLSIENKDEDDKSVIFKQTGYDEDEAHLVGLRLNEDVGILLGGNAQKFFDPFSDSMEFEENLGTKGFFPGMMMAMEALMSTVSGVMRNSEKRNDAVAGIEKALESHKKFVMSLTKNLPQVAFKLEDLDRFALAETAKGDCTKCADKAKALHETSHDRAAGEGTDFMGCPPGTQRDEKGNCVEMLADEQGHGIIEAGSGNEVTTGDDGSAVGQAKVAKSPGNPDENNANLSGAALCGPGTHLVDGQCVPLETGDTTQPPPPVGTGAGQLGAETGEMLKALTTLTETVKTLATAFGGLTGKMEKLEKDTGATRDRLDGVEKAAKAAEDAVGSTALIGAQRHAAEDMDIDSGMRQDRTRKVDPRAGFWGGTQMEKMFDPQFTADLREPETV